MDLSVSMNLPPEVERQLQGDHSGLAAIAREAVAVDLFRRGILTHLQLGQILGIDRFETDALLKQHQVWEQSLGHADVDADLRSIDELIGPPRR
jgi:predicted HTH domain antitoxin